MSTPVPRGRRHGPALLYLVFVLALSLAVLPGVSPRATAAPYAAMVMDARSGEVLHSRNADTRLHPASLTKMMTLYIAFEAVENGEIGLDDMVTISRNAAAEVPSKLGLRAGSRIELRYLIRASAVKSANDAATAIGEAIEGSEAAFARRMNRTAKALGMTRTTFRNAHGLTEEGHLSTARDMTILGRRLFFDYPEYYNLFSRRSTSAKLKTVYNTNRRFLAAYSGADGIKTGYTRAAGFNLVASAERGPRRIIATVFGGNSTATRNKEVARLLDLGFDRAPRHARLRRPAPPDYGATSGSGPAGRVVRYVRAVPQSIRPQPRPGPGAPEAVPPDAAALAALSTGIEAAVAEAAAAEPAAADADTADGPAVDRSAADAAPAGANGGAMSADGAAPRTALAPRPRPGPAREEPAPTANAEAPDAEPTEATAVAARAGEPRPAPAGTEGPVARPVAIAAAATASAGLTDATARTVERAVDQAAPRAVSFLRTASDPAPRPEAAEPTGNGAAEAVREIVARVSTSGGRHWGITLGRYPSRFAAERELLRTALAEMSALEGALRKVAREPGGFRANFVGMSAEQAEIACRRLTARGRSCKTLGPG